MNPVETPETALSVLELFSTSKESCNNFANQVVTNIRDGQIDPLRVHVLLKAMETTIELIRKNAKTETENEAEKYGEKPFMFAGAEVHYTATRTEYDYSKCGDPEWEHLDNQIKETTISRKDRETFLKGLKKPETIINQETGEVVTIRPPLKKQSMGVKVSIK